MHPLNLKKSSLSKFSWLHLLKSLFLVFVLFVCVFFVSFLIILMSVKKLVWLAKNHNKNHILGKTTHHPDLHNLV